MCYNCDGVVDCEKRDWVCVRLLGIQSSWHFMLGIEEAYEANEESKTFEDLSFP